MLFLAPLWHPENEKCLYLQSKEAKSKYKMAVKKNFRTDNVYLVSQDTTDNPKLLAKVLSDGRESLFLEYYLGYTMEYSDKLDKMVSKKHRKKEYLSLYLWQAPRTPLERQQNKETLDLAKKIRFEKSQELLNNLEGYRLKRSRDINFIDYYQDYINGYTKKDIRMVKNSLDCFKAFLIETPEYSKFSKMLKPEQIDKDMVLAFVEFLQHYYNGETPKAYYSRFKKVILYAIEHDIITKNPCKGVSIKIDDGQLKKDVLSQEEIMLLLNAKHPDENPNIRRAFIFCLYTGIRFCDVKDLTFSNVDYSNKLLKFEQNKTKGHSASSGVVIPLNDGLLNLIGTPESNDNRNELIFPLPSHTMCLKALERWTKRAGINKHITWHCARHSFAVNILNNGANIKTVASLLGHSGLKHTEKYTRAIDSLKQDAINSLPTLNFE